VAGGEVGRHGDESDRRRCGRAGPADDRQVPREGRVEGDGDRALRRGQRGERLRQDCRPGPGEHQWQDRLPLAGLDGDDGADAVPAEGTVEQVTA
jgi:hypothetical protein